MGTIAALSKASKGFADQLRARHRFDSWLNTVTGLGTSAFDKRQHHQIQGVRRIAPSVLDALYHCDDMAARIVDAVVEHALMLSYEVSQDEEGRLRSERAAWDLDTKIEAAAKWGRLFGGAAIWIGTDAGGRQEEPLDLEQISGGSVKFLMVLEGPNDMAPVTYYRDPMHPKFGQPETYSVHRTTAEGIISDGAALGALVHESRFVFFEGADTSWRQKQHNGGWCHSVLQRPYEVIRDADANWKSFSRLLDNASQAVYKIKGLVDMIAEGQSEIMQDRMTIVELARSMARAVVLDADLEDFGQIGAQNFTGASQAMEKSFQRLAAAARMPVTILMGMSPSGMNATGESDMRSWFNTVQTYRRDALEPQIRTLTKVLAANAGIALGDEPEIEWPSLWQMSPVEEAQHKFQISQRDAVYESLGVLTGPQIAKARWGGGVYSDGGEADVIDFDAIEDLDAAPLDLPGILPDSAPSGVSLAELNTVSGDSNVQQSALNGAQVKSILDLVQLVAQGLLPRDTAVELILSAFPIDRPQADRILGSVGRGFVPTAVNVPGEAVTASPSQTAEAEE